MSLPIKKHNPTILEEELAGLPSMHRLLFAVLVCERLIPKYQAFAAEMQCGNSEIFRSAINKIWDFLAGESLSRIEVEELIQNCQKWIPNSRAYDPVLSSAALDAAISVMETLECCLDPVPERVARIGNLALYSISISIQHQELANDPDSVTPEKILTNPLMIREIRRQGSDLKKLYSHGKELETDFLSTVRRSIRWVNETRSVSKKAAGKLCSNQWKLNKK